MAKFFWKPASGVNADIERHRNQEAEILGKIALYEGKTDKRSLGILATYRNFLYQLELSKAEVVSKIGKKV